MLSKRKTLLFKRKKKKTQSKVGLEILKLQNRKIFSNKTSFAWRKEGVETLDSYTNEGEGNSPFIDEAGKQT